MENAPLRKASNRKFLVRSSQKKKITTQECRKKLFFAWKSERTTNVAPYRDPKCPCTHHYPITIYEMAVPRNIMSFASTSTRFHLFPRPVSDRNLAFNIQVVSDKNTFRRSTWIRTWGENIRSVVTANPSHFTPWKLQRFSRSAVGTREKRNERNETISSRTGNARPLALEDTRRLARRPASQDADRQTLSRRVVYVTWMCLWVRASENLQDSPVLDY